MHRNSLVVLPDAISFQHGCFLNCTAAVALRAFRMAKTKLGDLLVITGASGGVGVHALQLVVALGRLAVCITSDPSKVPSLLALGAHKVILSNPDGSFHKEGEETRSSAS
jgi:acryloyl-coenzyme A reductase